MATVYTKTAKGRAEIETRAHRLVPRLRSLLILVDGRRSDAELAGLIMHEPMQAIEQLLAQGFIEAVAAAAPPPAPPAPTPAAAPAPPATIPFDQRRRLAVRALNDLLGPMGEGLALRMERAKTAEDLRPHLLSAMQIIADQHGRDTAEDYGRRFVD